MGKIPTFQLLNFTRLPAIFALYHKSQWEAPTLHTDHFQGRREDLGTGLARALWPCFFLVVGFQLPSKRATTDITFTAQMIIYVHLKQKTFWYQVFFSEFRYHFRVAQECSKTKGLVWEWLLPFFYGMELPYAIIFVYIDF